MNLIYYDIENNSELISKLLEFETDICKCYYQTTSMTTLRAKNKWFAFIKFIFKQNGFSLYSKRYEIIKDDEKIKTQTKITQIVIHHIKIALDKNYHVILNNIKIATKTVQTKSNTIEQYEKIILDLRNKINNLENKYSNVEQLYKEKCTEIEYLKQNQTVNKNYYFS